MSTETLTRNTRPDAGADDNNFDDPPPAELFTPDGEGDDYYSINDGIDKLEEHANAPSVTDGWEERARDVRPGRGYEFRDLSKTDRILGDVATTGFDRRRPISDYGMPRIQTRRRIGRIVIPGANV